MAKLEQNKCRCEMSDGFNLKERHTARKTWVKMSMFYTEWIAKARELQKTKNGWKSLCEILAKIIWFYCLTSTGWEQRTLPRNSSLFSPGGWKPTVLAVISFCIQNPITVSWSTSVKIQHPIWNQSHVPLWKTMSKCAINKRQFWNRRIERLPQSSPKTKFLAGTKLGLLYQQLLLPLYAVSEHMHTFSWITNLAYLHMIAHSCTQLCWKVRFSCSLEKR